MSADHENRKREPVEMKIRPRDKKQYHVDRVSSDRRFYSDYLRQPHHHRTQSHLIQYIHVF